MSYAGRSLFCLVVLAGALLLEVTILTRLPLPKATPDLVLLAVLGFGLAYGRLPGALIGFAAGLAVDLTPPAVTVLGREALVLCLAGYSAGAVRELGRSWRQVLPLVGGASLVALFLTGVLGEVAGAGVVSWPLLVDLAPYTVAYNLAFAPLLVVGVLAFARRFPPAASGRLR